MLGIPAVLVQQRDRDLEGHGISLRSVAEASWARTALDDKRGMHVHRTELMRACTQLAVSFDRLLGDGQRCEAYCAAIDGALAAGAHTFAFLGTGSLLPALHAAHNGGRVVMVEPCEPLAQLASAAAAENELPIVVVASLEMLRAAWSGVAPDVLISERIDEGLLSEGIVPQLRVASQVLCGSSAPRHVLPRMATVSAVACQLGFEGVAGFGLDGLDIDMSSFEALRPNGERALNHPGYWPVRLVSARQPHRRLSREFTVGRVHFDDARVFNDQSHRGACEGDAATFTSWSDLLARHTSHHPEGSHDVQSRELSIEVSEGGLLNAIVYWFELEVGRDHLARVSSAPPDAGSRHGAAGSWSEGWKQAACYLEKPVYVQRDTTLRLRVTIDLARGLRFEALEDHRSTGHNSRKVPLTYDCLFALGIPPRQLHTTASIPITAYHFAMVVPPACSKLLS